MVCLGKGRKVLERELRGRGRVLNEAGRKTQADPKGAGVASSW